MTIGERFALILKEKGVTQKSFSERIGYSEQSISKLIKGQTLSPKADLIAQIAVLLPDVNLRWLLIGDGEMFIENKNDNNLLLENSRLKEELLSSKTHYYTFFLLLRKNFYSPQSKWSFAAFFKSSKATFE
jgi:transcriptional regulator with XRE-family HTH domain